MWHVLATVLALAMFTACSQPANAPSEPEKEAVETAVEEKPQLAEMTPKAACATFPSSQHALEYVDNEATQAEERVLDSDGDGWPCNEPGVVPASEAATTEPTGLQPAPRILRVELPG